MKKIVIRLNGSSYTENAVVKVNLSQYISSELEYKSIFFETAKGKKVFFWSEHDINNIHTGNFWIKLDEINNSDIEIIAKIDYKNDIYNNEFNSIDNTFLLGDDFNNSNLDTNKWLFRSKPTGDFYLIQNSKIRIPYNVPATVDIGTFALESNQNFQFPIIIEVLFDSTGDQYFGPGALGMMFIDDTYLWTGTSDWSDLRYVIRNGPYATNSGVYYSPGIHRIKFRITQTLLESFVYVNGLLKASFSRSDSISAQSKVYWNIHYNTSSGNPYSASHYQDLDWFIVYKMLSPEPTVKKIGMFHENANIYSFVSSLGGIIKNFKTNSYVEAITRKNLYSNTANETAQTMTTKTSVNIEIVATITKNATLIVDTTQQLENTLSNVVNIQKSIQNMLSSITDLSYTSSIDSAISVEILQNIFNNTSSLIETAQTLIKDISVLNDVADLTIIRKYVSILHEIIEQKQYDISTVNEIQKDISFKYSNVLNIVDTIIKKLEVILNNAKITTTNINNLLELVSSKEIDASTNQELKSKISKDFAILNELVESLSQLIVKLRTLYEKGNKYRTFHVKENL